MKVACTHCGVEHECSAELSDVDVVIESGGARNDDPHTSHAAKVKGLGPHTAHRFRMAMVLYRHRHDDGCTAEEAAFEAGIPAKSSPWKRFSELEHDLCYIEYAGVDRRTTSGSPARVMRVTPLGRAKLAELDTDF